MYLERLQLTHFKNYRQQLLELSPRLNCFVGRNGMGKTNVLDAIHLLCLCRSHTHLPDRLLVQHGESFYRVEGLFDTDTGKVRIAARFAAGKQKEMERNGSVYDRLSDYIGLFPVVMIAPDDVSLIREGSEERRRFLDATLSQVYPDYLHALIRYNHLLRQRNALLKSFSVGMPFDPALLEALDRQLPAPARLLFERRQAFVTAFEPLLKAYYADISEGHETVSARYDADQQEASLETLLAARLEQDRRLERTGAGPHRDDLQLDMDDRPVKKFSSQGQVKSFLLALRLAQYELLRREKGVAPLLLLDDIFDKLDEHRVRRLLTLLSQRDVGQLFLTDTQRGRMEKVMEGFPGDVAFFEVEEGQVARLA